MTTSHNNVILQPTHADGVLEIRKEKFHAIALSADHKSYGLMLFGSIDVRIRRDANPQMVLAHVYNKISPLVHQLTIQVSAAFSWCPLEVFRASMVFRYTLARFTMFFVTYVFIQSRDRCQFFTLAFPKAVLCKIEPFKAYSVI